jgi:hypothetical protein
MWPYSLIKKIAFGFYILITLYSFVFFYNLRIKLDYIVDHLKKQDHINGMFNVVVPEDTETCIEEI